METVGTRHLPVGTEKSLKSNSNHCLHPTWHLIFHYSQDFEKIRARCLLLSTCCFLVSFCVCFFAVLPSAPTTKTSPSTKLFSILPTKRFFHPSTLLFASPSLPSRSFTTFRVHSQRKRHSEMQSSTGEHQKRGSFILFEGVDRCGKTTQSELLAKYLNENSGKPAELIRFPDRNTTIGQIIDSYLKSKNDLNDHSIHLLFSANRWERKKYIEESLAQGKTLVSMEVYVVSWILLVLCLVVGLRQICLLGSRVYLSERSRFGVVPVLRSGSTISWCDHLFRYPSRRGLAGKIH